MKERIGILGNTGNNVFSTYSWFCRTVSQGMKLNGCDVFWLDYKTSSIDKIRNWILKNKIEILFTHLTFHNHKPIGDILGLFEELRNLNVKIIHTLQDARDTPRYNGDISFAFDMAFVSTYKNVEKFQKIWKVPVHFWPYSSITYDEMGKYNKNLDFKIPVFPGNIKAHNDRRNFIEKLQKIMNIKIIKTKSPEDIRNKTLDFCASNKCVLSLSTRYELDIGFTDVRPWQYLGAGGILICRPHNMQELIIPDDLYFTFNSYDDPYIVKELWEKIKSMNENEINNMRNQAFNFIQKYHSSKIRMKQTLEIIKEKRNKLDIFLSEINYC